MSQGAAQVVASDSPTAMASSEPQAWPREVSHSPELSIGALVEIVKGEFPATTVSKIRFIEEKGLIKPHRTASGYRQYSRADVERIRFILSQQRDSYAPLRVIHDQLCALDSGHDAQPVPTARLVAAEGKVVVPTANTVTARELIDLTDATEEQLEEYAKLGLVVPDLAGHFPARCVRIVAALRALADAGVPPRLLRSVKQGAERSADIIDQAISSRENRNRPGEKERAAAQATDLTESFGALHQDFLAIAVAALTDI